MIRVGVSGVAGRMGRLVAEAVAAAPDLDLAEGYDPGAAGQAVSGIRIGADPEAMGAAEVVVEFTNPAVVLDNLARWRALGLHAVVGTSGFDAARLDALRRDLGKRHRPVPRRAQLLHRGGADDALRRRRGAALRRRRDRRTAPRPQGRCPLGHRPGHRGRHGRGRRARTSGRWTRRSRLPASGAAQPEGVRDPLACACPGLLAHQEVILGLARGDADHPSRHQRPRFLPARGAAGGAEGGGLARPGDRRPGGAAAKGGAPIGCRPSDGGGGRSAYPALRRTYRVPLGGLSTGRWRGPGGRRRSGDGPPRARRRCRPWPGGPLRGLRLRP